MAEHTPGPWRRCGGYSPYYTAIRSASGYIVFSMADSTEHRECGKAITAPDTETQRANSRLIAAAPDLLAACKLAADAFERQSDHMRDKQCNVIKPPLEELYAAMGKAKPKPPGPDATMEVLDEPEAIGGADGRDG